LLSSVHLLNCNYFKDQIGISTPLINALVEKYKNQFLKETDTKNTKKAMKVTREKKPKPPKIPKESKTPKTKRVIETKNLKKQKPREKRFKYRKIKTILQLSETDKTSSKSIKTRQNENKNSKAAKSNIDNHTKKISVKDALIQNILDYSKLVGPLVKVDAGPQKTKKLTINQILENRNENKSLAKTLIKQTIGQNTQSVTSSSLIETNTLSSGQNTILEGLNKVTLNENTSSSSQLQVVVEKRQNEIIINKQHFNNNFLIVNISAVEGRCF
jgi:hypothetical protein